MHKDEVKIAAKNVMKQVGEKSFYRQSSWEEMGDSFSKTTSKDATTLY